MKTPSEQRQKRTQSQQLEAQEQDANHLADLSNIQKHGWNVVVKSDRIVIKAPECIGCTAETGPQPDCPICGQVCGV